MIEVKFATGATIVLSLIVLGCLGLCAKRILCAKFIECGKIRKCFKNKKEEKEGNKPESKLDSEEFE